jgi:hypothetical protein
MIIQGINQYRQLEASFKASKMKPKASTAVFTVPKDKIEIAPKKPEIRESLVNNVRKKVDLGFYNSPSVIEQLSDSFAQAMNQA